MALNGPAGTSIPADPGWMRTIGQGRAISRPTPGGAPSLHPTLVCAEGDELLVRLARLLGPADPAAVPSDVAA